VTICRRSSPEPGRGPPRGGARDAGGRAWWTAAHALEAFCRVILPLTAPGLAAATIFVSPASWNEFLFAIVLAGGGKAKTWWPPPS